MIYILAILAGAVAGVINTLAGSGSLVTLPMLVFLGLPANVANATNRVGVVFQNIVGIATFQRAGALETSGALWLTLPALPGALLGTWIATILDADQMETSIGVVMVLMLIVILIEPKKWLRKESSVKPGRPGWLTLAIFFVIGIYGGFIQAGVGVFLLAAMVLIEGYSLTHANAIKLVIVLAFTLVALALFAASGQVNWGIGLLMAVGQSIGAWLAARFATRYENANLWVRRLLIAVVVIAIVRFFNLWELFGLWKLPPN